MKPSRRELLTGMLGVPLVAAGCRPHRTHYDGQMVGGAAAFGHRLRSPDALRNVPLDAPASNVGVLIVGAGPSALSAAWRLAHAGEDDVLVLDLEDAAGGTSRSGRNAVSAYPWGAHYVPAPLANNTLLAALLREMGAVEGVRNDGSVVVAEPYLVRDLDERLFVGGTWHAGLLPPEVFSTRSETQQWHAFRAEIDRWVGYRDAQGRRAFAIPMAQSSDDPSVLALDRLSMAQWMDQHGFDSPRLRWWVDYACRDDYGMHMEHTSAWAGLFYFASRVPAPGQDSAELIAWPEGNGAFVQHLARAAAGRIRLGQLVTDVSLEHDRVRVRAIDAASGRAHEWLADRVILAVPKFIAAHILEPWRRSAPPGLDQFTYAPWLVANLTLREHPAVDDIEMAWDNVLYDSPSLGYVCATHQALRDYGPTVLTYYLPFPGPDPRRERARLLAGDWTEWSERIVADLATAHPDLPQLLERVDVYRWGHGMIRPTTGFLFGGAREAAAAPIDARVFFAHSDLSGLALFEEAQYRGVVAAEAVLAARGARVERWT